MSSSNDEQGPVGCYLVYEPASGGRLMLHYSMGIVPNNAVGFWMPGPNHSIQGFKFRQAGGRSELIKGIAGGEAGKRKYFAGWCMFLKMAKAMQGRVIQFNCGTEDRQGLPVDVYGYQNKAQHPLFLDVEAGLVDISPYDAVAVVPRHAAFIKGVKSMAPTNFAEMGNLIGASTTMT